MSRLTAVPFGKHKPSIMNPKPTSSPWNRSLKNWRQSWRNVTRSFVAQMAHRPMLDELRDFGRISSLLAAQSAVQSSVRITNQELTKRLACLLKQHSCFGSKDIGFTLFDEINLVSKQVRHTIVNASQLHNLCSSVQSAYDEYNLTIMKALKRTQLDNRKSRMITAQPLFLKLIGINYTRMY